MVGNGVVVIGGANLDIVARSHDPLLPGTSNPGHTRMTPGGVGRNVAENLARLGTAVRLVSAVGDDPAGDRIVADTRAAGVDVTGVRRVTGGSTGTYTAVLAPDGELVTAVADMSAVDAITPEDLPDDLTDAALLVLDGNLAPPTIARALARARADGVPTAVDPVSAPKAARVAGLLTGVHLLTPNVDELAALTSPALDVPEAAAELHRRGADLVWVRLGGDGSLLSGPDGTTRLASVPADVVDVTGAGDAMLAAFCHALLAGAAPAEAAAYGHAAAALTVASAHAVRPDLTDDLVRSLM